MTLSDLFFFSSAPRHFFISLEKLNVFLGNYFNSCVFVLGNLVSFLAEALSVSEEMGSIPVGTGIYLCVGSGRNGLQCFHHQPFFVL